LPKILTDARKNKKTFFMKLTRRTKIRFEKLELTQVRVSRNASFFCKNCQSETEHLTVAQAAFALVVSEKSIFYMTENERFHSIETANGQILICAASFVFGDTDLKINGVLK
jgi:hypothetical protein